MKRKQFLKGVEQIAQEGAIQIFKTPYSGMEEVIVGVVGTLQFDVLEYRLRSEYNVELYKEGLPFEYLRWIVKEDEDAPCPERGGPAAPQRRQAGGGLQGQPAAAVRLPVVHPVGAGPEQEPEAGRVRRGQVLRRSAGACSPRPSPGHMDPPPAKKPPGGGFSLSQVPLLNGSLAAYSRMTDLHRIRGRRHGGTSGAGETRSVRCGEG